MRIIAVGVVAAVALTAAVLGGCGGDQHRSTSGGVISEEPGATVTPAPKSRLLPALVLPSGSRLGHSETTEDGWGVELWYLPIGFSETVEYLRDLLPVNRQFADLDYAGENPGIDEWGAEYVQWSWDDHRYSGEGNARAIQVRAVDRPRDETLVAVGVQGSR
ncbi:MAG: hypothetical protein K0U84_08345 [Actinomycetia bacterium]|nr:hypothetical protein [Actinomycetes bacterium]